MPKIVLNNLKFSNMFSYSEKENNINFNNNKITQLTAPNGSGKSSIALILQEVLFNKNIKGIKKADIINRWAKTKTWWAELDFFVDEKPYSIKIKRTGTKSEVLFYRENKDLSEHKVLDTYKSIQDILNLDFNIFSQLTYQSSVDLLEFLKATDTNRKKFLINLFNLEKYIKIGEVLSLKLKDELRDKVLLQNELSTLNKFLDSTNIAEKKISIDVPEVAEDLVKQLGLLEKQLEDYSTICKNIDKNNMYIQERDTLTFDVSMKIPKEEPELYEGLEEFKNDINKLHIHKRNIEKSLKEVDTTDTCYACGQTIDNSRSKDLMKNLDKDLYNTTIKLETLKEELEYAKTNVESYENSLNKYNKNKIAITKFEDLSQVIDNTITTEYPNFGDLEEQKQYLHTTIKAQTYERENAITHNQQVGIHNAKIDALLEQKEDFLSRQKIIKNDIIYVSDQINNLEILRKAFSTSGIVAFKLENLTKELEATINHYLSLLSDGQFQVSFRLDKEKLNIIVSNNGIDTPIETVSGGEFSRIQTAILLAIRSLLSKLGGSSINLLFLDEITGVLDEEGKEKLIEVLSEDKNLNVFLISHDFTHPLIDKISIIKENNISSIQ
jgi:DNA repair exonuclease SbcCD ATPase subunit